MWQSWYKKGSTSISNIDVGLKPETCMVTVSECWVRVEAQGLSCTCVLPRVFQFINPVLFSASAKVNFSQLQLSHTHVFFLQSYFSSTECRKTRVFPWSLQLMWSKVVICSLSKVREIPHGSKWSIPDRGFLPLPVQYGLCFSMKTKAFVLLSHTPEQ